MILKRALSKAYGKSTVFCAFVSMMGGMQKVSAQNQTDTIRRPVLAMLEKKTLSAYIIKQPAVIFSEILKGSEAKMKAYIEKFCQEKRDYLVSMYTKGKNLLAKTEKILKKYDLPPELKILLTLESAYDGNAVSRRGAVGYWQIMDEVAGEYGMRYVSRVNSGEKTRSLKAGRGETRTKLISGLKDDRKNFIISTNTAARYLQDRARNLDANWLLVVASYNCGMGKVRRAIKKSGKVDPDFWDIKDYLPGETRAYVMNFIALNVIFDNYDLFANNKLSFAPEKILLPDDIDKNTTAPLTQ